MGDVTYFTESYLDILNDKPEYKAPSSVHGKEKRAAVRDRRWLWPSGRIPYTFSTYYYGEPSTRTYLYLIVKKIVKCQNLDLSLNRLSLYRHAVLIGLA